MLDTTLIILIGIGIVELVLFVWMIQMERRLKLLFRGTKAKSLEEHFATLSAQVEKLTVNERDLYEHIAKTDARLKKSIRNIEIVRFNPFPGEGSNQSFAIALINDEGNGIVMSSLYSRERMSVFAKQVKEGTPAHELTQEERDVLSRAQNI